VALHPALVPYTAAVDDRRASRAALLVVAAAFAERAHRARGLGFIVACGVVDGRGDVG